MLGIKVHPLNFRLTRESIPFGLRQLGYKDSIDKI
jgi:hypothetical protein